MSWVMLRVAVFAALPWECKSVLRSLARVRRGQSAGVKWWEGEGGSCHVRLVQTGIGVERAATATRVILDEIPCTLAVVTGCAGGLSATLEAGTLLVADEVVCGVTGSTYSVPEALTAAFKSMTRTLDIKAEVGRQLCVAEALTSVAAKQQAAIRFRALGVDMESAGVAREATERGVPFACIRAILDTALAALPATNGLIDPASGRIRARNVLRHVVRGGVQGWQGLHELYTWKQCAESSLTRFYRQCFAQRACETLATFAGEA